MLSISNVVALIMQTDFKKYGSSYSFGVNDEDDHPIGIKLQTLTSPSTSTFYKSTEALQRIKYREDEEELDTSPPGIAAWSTVAGA